MREVIWLMHLSLDGFVSGPKGELDWAGAAMDDQLWEDVQDLLRTVDGALFGRVTYQMFENYWPAVARNGSSSKNKREFAVWIDNTPKTVASKTLKGLEWKNSTLLSDHVVEGVSRMKNQPGGNLLMFGSPSLASVLFEANLIDELHLKMHPVLLGAGRPLFHGATERRKLELVTSRTFDSGVVGLRYNVAGS